jgi:hypothetical protein
MEVFSMSDIERIEEYFINLKKPYGEYHTVDAHDIDMCWINPCLHQFEGQETNDSIYVVANSTYRSIGFLDVEVDVYIAMTALGIDKKLIELIKYSPKEDYKPYQIMFITNGSKYMESEFINLALNNGITDMYVILDIILHRCMKYHKNIPAFEKLLNKHGDVNIITRLLDERTYTGNNLAYTGEYRILLLRWMNEHLIEGGFEL